MYSVSKMLVNFFFICQDLAKNPSVEELQPLLKDLLTNLLNNQNAGMFTDSPQELWYAKTGERKTLVLRNLRWEKERGGLC